MCHIASSHHHCMHTLKRQDVFQELNAVCHILHLLLEQTDSHIKSSIMMLQAQLRLVIQAKIQYWASPLLTCMDWL